MTPEEFYSILYSMPEPQPLRFRLYHDDQGRPLFYSMEDLPGKWISVDAQTYAAASHDLRVIGDRAVPISRTAQIQKLKPHLQGVACDPRDICLVVDPQQPHVKWSMTANED